MLIMYFNAEIQIVSLVNFTLLSQRSFVPSLASVTKSAVVGHFLSLREPTIIDRIFFRLFTIEINTGIANNLKPIGMMKMRVTIYPNTYECVAVYMKIHHDRF